MLSGFRTIWAATELANFTLVEFFLGMKMRIKDKSRKVNESYRKRRLPTTIFAGADDLQGENYTSAISLTIVVFKGSLLMSS